MYWYVEGDPQLSTRARTLIQDTSNEILVSPASYRESAIKIRIGKWRLNRSCEEFIDIVLNQYGFRVLPILPEHTARLLALSLHPGHKDPFDRLLLPQALVEQIPIISADTPLNAYSISRF